MPGRSPVPRPRDWGSPRTPDADAASRTDLDRDASQPGRRQVGTEAGPDPREDVRGHGPGELAERRRTRRGREQGTAVPPRGVLGLQVEPQAERRMAEHVV